MQRRWWLQTGLPMAALSVAGAQWRLKPKERVRLNTELLPWALRAGNHCSDLMCLYYEEHFKVWAHSAFRPVASLSQAVHAPPWECLLCCGKRPCRHLPASVWERAAGGLHGCNA